MYERVSYPAPTSANMADATENALSAPYKMAAGSGDGYETRGVGAHTDLIHRVSPPDTDRCQFEYNYCLMVMVLG